MILANLRGIPDIEHSMYRPVLLLSGALFGLTTSVLAQRSNAPAFLTTTYTSHTLTAHSETFQGLMLGISFTVAGPVQLAIRGHYLRTDDEGLLGGELLLQGGIHREPFELVGMAGMTAWGPDYTGEYSDEALTRVTTLIGAQLRAWPIRRVGIVWEATKRGLLDERLDGGHEFAIGLMLRF